MNNCLKAGRGNFLAKRYLKSLYSCDKKYQTSKFSLKHYQINGKVNDKVDSNLS